MRARSPRTRICKACPERYRDNLTLGGYPSPRAPQGREGWSGLGHYASLSPWGYARPEAAPANLPVILYIARIRPSVQGFSGSSTKFTGFRPSISQSGTDANGPKPQPVVLIGSMSPTN